MEMLQHNVFCLVVIFCEVRNELILKIDLDEENYKQTTINKLYITFVNTTDSHLFENGNISMDLSAKNDIFGHQLVKRNPDSTPMRVPLDIGDNTHSPEKMNIKVPIAQDKGDVSEIKAHLDNFRMRKRRTYVSTPNFDFPFVYFNKKRDQVYSNYRRNLPDYSMIEREDKIYQVLTKQNELMERVANNLLLREERKKKIARSYFDDILDSVEKRQSTVQPVQNKTKATTKKATTVRTVIDETEVRKALMKDPFVSRILRMAGRKKKEYESQKAKEEEFLV